MWPDGPPFVLWFVLWFSHSVPFHSSRERQGKAKDRAERREMCLLEVMETEKSYVEVRTAFLGSDLRF